MFDTGKSPQPGHFGRHGGRFVAETLIGPLQELATAYDAFFKESQSEDGRTFRSWLEKRRDTESRAVLTFVRSLKATLVQIERLGLTRHELEVSKSQIYGNLLRPRLNADADFLRLLVEGDLDEPVKPATNAALPGAPERSLS